MYPKKRYKGSLYPLPQAPCPSLSCRAFLVFGGPNAQADIHCWRRYGDVAGVNGMGESLVGAGPLET